MTIPDVTHHRAQLDDLSVHYVTAGDPAGSPVVLLHGYPQTWYCWAEVIPQLAAAGFFVIAPDLRGLGDTGRPASGYDKKTIASDVASLLTDHLHLDRVSAVGHDWGGATAFALAAHNPGLVTRLAVVDVAIPGDGQANIGQGGRRWHHTFLQTLDLPEALIHGREEIWVRWFYDNYGAHPGVISEQAVAEYLRTYRSFGAVRSGIAYYRAVSQDVLDNQGLPPLTIPTLAVGGGTGFGRGDEVERSLRRMATDVRAVVFPDAGHWVPEEEPDALARELIAFLTD